MFVYKNTETIEYVKMYPIFKKNTIFTGKLTREFLELRMRNFQGFVLI